jgi:hypothetical protein
VLSFSVCGSLKNLEFLRWLGVAVRAGSRTSFLVVAGEYACRVVRIVDFDGRRDERTQGCVDLEGGEESFAGREVGAVEHSGRMSGSKRRRCSAINSSLPEKCW